MTQTRCKKHSHFLDEKPLKSYKQRSPLYFCLSSRALIPHDDHHRICDVNLKSETASERKCDRKQLVTWWKWQKRCLPKEEVSHFRKVPSKLCGLDHSTPTALFSVPVLLETQVALFSVRATIESGDLLCHSISRPCSQLNYILWHCSIFSPCKY